MFYKKADKYIEHTSHRINTPGEIREVSARGWIAERRKIEKTFHIKSPIRKKTKIIDGNKIWKDLKIEELESPYNINRLMKGGFDIGF